MYVIASPAEGKTDRQEVNLFIDPVVYFGCFPQTSSVGVKTPPTSQHLEPEALRRQSPGVTGVGTHQMLHFCGPLALMGSEVETDDLDPSSPAPHICCGVLASGPRTACPRAPSSPGQAGKHWPQCCGPGKADSCVPDPVDLPFLPPQGLREEPQSPSSPGGSPLWSPQPLAGSSILSIPGSVSQSELLSPPALRDHRGAFSKEF